MDLLKRSSPYFFQGFLSRLQEMVLVNPFLRFTKTTDFYTKIPGLEGKGFLNDFWKCGGWGLYPFPINSQNWFLADFVLTV